MVAFVSDANNGGTGCTASPYIVTRTYSVTDDCGNSINVKQTINAIDDMPPQLNLPVLGSYECIDELPAPYADYGTFIAAGGTSSDNCGLNTSSFILLTELTVPIGNDFQVTRTYKISDNCNNSVQVNQIIMVEDNTAPVITCPGNVTLCAEDASGAIVSGIGLISALDNCTVPGNLNIQYNITGTTTSSGTDDASGTFFNNGTSTLLYTVTDESNNEATCSTVILINPIPTTSEISGNINPVCFALDEIYSVTGASASHYLWTVPEEATITSDTSGTGKISVHVEFGSISGPITVTEISEQICEGETKTLDISLQGCELNADFDMDKNEACTEDIITFWSTSTGVSGSATYSWNFGLDAVPPNKTGPGPHQVIYTNSGIKTVKLTVSDYITDSISKNITIHDLPDISLSGDDRCGEGSLLFIASTINGTYVNFSDDGGSTIVSTDNSAPFEYTVSANEEDEITLWAQSVNENTGCRSEWSDALTLIAHPLPITGPIIAENSTENYLDISCRYDTRHYYVNEVIGSTYNWNIPGLVISYNNTNEIDVTWIPDEGEYTITVQEISEAGCQGSIHEGTVFVSDPQVDLGEDQEICHGESYVFNAGDDFISYLWPDGSNASEYTGTESETIWVQVENEYQCVASDTVELLVFNNPILNLGNDTAICDEEGYELIVEGFNNYHWYSGETGNSITVYPGTGLVWLQVFNENGCQATDTILILECDPNTQFENISNTFTPNGDGVHDTWVINNIDLYPDAEIEVYDRTGRRVFYVNGGYANDWNGTFDGKPLPMDTYYFVINFKSDQIKPKKGTITIIR